MIDYHSDNRVYYGENLVNERMKWITAESTVDQNYIPWLKHAWILAADQVCKKTECILKETKIENTTQVIGDNEWWLIVIEMVFDDADSLDDESEDDDRVIDDHGWRWWWRL